MRALAKLLGKLERQKTPSPGLKALSIADNFADGRAMIYLAFPPAASMTSLNLSGNIMELKGVSVLAQSPRSLHVLEELYLGHNWIGMQEWRR